MTAKKQQIEQKDESRDLDVHQEQADGFSWSESQTGSHHKAPGKAGARPRSDS